MNWSIMSMALTPSRSNCAMRRGALMRGAALLHMEKLAIVLLISIALLVSPIAMNAQAPANDYLFNDSHFHLTNYIQEGPDIQDFLNIMGHKAGRVAIFGIPLQQQWSYSVDADRAPTYYLNSDAPLYYYSFTDAWIATAYKSLPKEERARFDPMITGFNPADMYAADHIRRVMRAFPGVFAGIGEFTIHKEFVSAKIAGEGASLQDQALDRIFDFATEVGLVILIHNDVDVPFAKPGSEPAYASQMKAPLWKLLSSDASEKVRKRNYERIFDEARRRVRRWEATNVKSVSAITGGLK